MQPVDVFVAAYLVGIMVILGVLSILAYRKQAAKNCSDKKENK